MLNSGVDVRLLQVDAAGNALPTGSTGSIGFRTPIGFDASFCVDLRKK